MAPAEAGRRLLALGVDPGRPYLLHVGGNQWYKNRLGVLRIFEAFCRDPRSEHLALVMAGKPFTEALMDFVRAHGLGERVITPGAVYEEDLRALYSRARALLFPSLHEGFGWPVIEAQACGCPVFASNRPPLTEIGGDAAIPIDPEDPSAAAALIAQRLADPDALSDVRQHGRRNAARFSAKAMAAGYLEAYRRAMER
jgi:glycosyltransferase involved in cell wall biosynthesis